MGKLLVLIALVALQSTAAFLPVSSSSSSALSEASQRLSTRGAPAIISRVRVQRDRSRGLSPGAVGAIVDTVPPLARLLGGGAYASTALFQQALLCNGIGALLLKYAAKQKSLTDVGLLHAAALGVGLWSFLGPKGWLVCVVYFVLGSLATKVKMAEKEKLGIAEKRGGSRGPENVWGSAATAMVCAALSGIVPVSWVPVLRVGYVASLATKLSDTWGSELGKAYGKTCYLITTLKLVPRGTEGAVSVEGTLAGVVGSVLLAGAAMGLGVVGATAQVLWTLVLSAFFATTVESWIGATFQDEATRPWLTNELVNLIMTVIGAAAAGAAGAVFSFP